MHLVNSVVAALPVQPSPKFIAPPEFGVPHGLAPLLPSATSWISASLLDSFRFIARRWRAKRNQLERLCDNFDVLFILEARGTSADLGQLPATHRWDGAFVPHPNDDYTSRHQPRYIFRPATDDPTAATYSRIDRWCSKLDELAFRRTRVLTGVVGGASRPRPATSHSSG